MILKRVYECESAHQLTDGVPEGHQCRRLHGHRYIVTVSIHGDVAKNGMLLEYNDLDAVTKPVIDLIDHRLLNRLGDDVRLDFTDLGTPKLVASPLAFEPAAVDAFALVRLNPTVENLTNWVYLELRERLYSQPRVGFMQPSILRVEIQEDSRSSTVRD